MGFIPSPDAGKLKPVEAITSPTYLTFHGEGSESEGDGYSKCLHLSHRAGARDRLGKEDLRLPDSASSLKAFTTPVPFCAFMKTAASQRKPRD